MSSDQSATRSIAIGLLGTALLAILAFVGMAPSANAEANKTPLVGHAPQEKASIHIDGSRGQFAKLSVKEFRALTKGAQISFRPPKFVDGAPRDLISLRVARARALGQGRFAWNLEDLQGAKAHAQFVVRNGVLAGAIHSGDNFWWRFISQNENTVLIDAINGSELPPCGGVEAAGNGEDQRDGPAAGGLALGGAEICSGTCQERTVDMAMFYTPLALAAVGGVEQIETLCELEVLQANIAFENSQSETRVRIVYLGEIDYDDSTESGHLGHFSDGNDGKMDSAQTIMGVTGADVGSLVVENGEGYCGVAQLGPARFHVLVRPCMGGYLLAHEFGHNLGGCHACGDGGGCGCGGAFSYSVGWRFLGNSSNEWHTVMAYGPGFSIPNYSNPDVLHDGQPTGVPIGDSGEADNVATFVLTTPMVSSFACPPAYVQTVKILPSDPAQLDLFGQSTAISDGRVIVGAYLSDEVATNSGATYVFGPASSSDGPCPPDPYGIESDQCFIQKAKPPVFGTRPNDGVGRAVAARDGWMVTGASLRDTVILDEDGKEIIDQAQVGSAFVYDRTGETWCFRQELFASNPSEDDRFGTAVAMDDQTIVVGIPRVDVDGDDLAGAFEFFQRTGPSDAPWVNGGMILGDPDDLGIGARYGSAVGVDGDHLAVGAPYAFDEQGTVHLYERQGSSWSFLQQLEYPDGTEGALFGSSLAISGDSLLVGAPKADSNDGRAYLFTFDGSSWSLHQTFTPLGGENESQFGASVALDVDHGLIGAPRSPNPSKELSDTGAAFMLKRVAETWYMVAILTAFDAEQGDEYGLSVAIEGDLLAVGAGYDNDNGIQSGSVYVHPFKPLVDCNDNGYGDVLEILQGITFDNNNNGRPDPCDCVGDMNFDGVVDGGDLTFFLNDWGRTGSNVRADVNLDGRVDGFDLTILLGTWGVCPTL